MLAYSVKVQGAAAHLINVGLTAAAYSAATFFVYPATRTFTHTALSTALGVAVDGGITGIESRIQRTDIYSAACDAVWEAASDLLRRPL